MNHLLFSAAALLSAALPLLTDASVKGTALLFAAGGATLALRKASAAARHLVWLLAAGALLVLPILLVLLPDWRVLPAWTAVAAAPATPPAEATTLSYTRITTTADPAMPPVPTVSDLQRWESVPSAAPEPASAPPWPAWFPLVWAAGCGLLLLRLMAAHWFLRQVSKRCVEARDGRLAKALQAARRQLRMEQPVRLLLDSRGTIPMVWGVWRPRVLLPAAAEEWKDSHLRSVLLHELAHIQRRDVAVQWLLQVVCALYWFNPLIWLAAWRLHVEGERASDDRVLSGGVRPSDYAEHLLDVATKLTPAHRVPACSLAMAQPSRLEGRLVAVLNGRINRRAMTRALTLGALVLVLGVTIPVAMLRAKAEPPAAQNAAEGKAADSPTAPAAAPEQRPAPEFSSVPALPWTAAGRVTDTAGKPLAEVEIWVHAGMGTLRRTGLVKTDGDGRYQVSFGRGILMPKDDPNLQYAQVTAHKAGFFETNLNRQGARAAALREVPAGDLKSYGVAVEQLFLPEKPQAIDFVMAPAARIKGRLVGTGNFPRLPPTAYRGRNSDRVVEFITLRQSPLANWRVTLTGQQLPPGSSVLASAESDANGEFVFENVPTGIAWQLQTDTHRPQPEPRSAPFKLSSAGEVVFELEIPDDQKTIQFLQTPEGRVLIRPAGAAPENEMAIDVAENGEIFWERRPVALDDLLLEVARQQSANSEIGVALRTARRAPMARIVELLDSLKQRGVKSVRFAAGQDDALAGRRERLKELDAELRKLRENGIAGQASEQELSRMKQLRAEMEVIKADSSLVKLEQTKAHRARLKQLHDASLISERELKEAEFAVAMSEAEMRGDPTEAARLQLQQAEEELKRVSPLREKRLISEADYSQVAATVEILRAKLAGDETEVARLKLRRAEANLKRLTELHNARLISQQELDRAQIEARIAAAELEGNAAEVTRARQEFAEAELKRATELHKRRLISDEEFLKAKEAAERAKQR